MKDGIRLLIRMRCFGKDSAHTRVAGGAENALCLESTRK